MNSFTLHVVYTLKDLQNGALANFQKGRAYKSTLLILFLFLLYLLVFGYALIESYNWLMAIFGPLSLFLLILLLFVLYSLFLVPKRDFKRNTGFLDEFKITINNNSIKYKSKKVELETPWSQYTKYVETDDVFLFFLNKASYHLIPKRALNPTQMAELKKLAKEKIGKVTK